jgi:hypothetical protein
VSEHFFAGTDQESWGPLDYPSIAPPFEVFWMETRAPARISSSVHGDQPWNNGARAWGALFYSRVTEHPAQDQQRWEMVAAPFVLFDGALRGPMRSPIFSVAGDGRWLLPTGRVPTIGPSGNSVANMTVQAQTSIDIVKDLLLAISFMHCSNVKTRGHLPPPGLSKRNEERHGRPLVKFYTLDINPMRKVLETEGGLGEIGLKRALHLCRGHFKDYRESGGLFGKHKGLYWWEANVRGTVEKGIVAKDYRVQAPKGGQ